MSRDRKAKKAARQRVLATRPGVTESDTPEDLAGLAVHDVIQVRVAEYHELPGGQGAPSQVHLMLTIRGQALPTAQRIRCAVKSRSAADAIIGSLERHADNVWPEE